MRWPWRTAALACVIVSGCARRPASAPQTAAPSTARPMTPGNGVPSTDEPSPSGVGTNGSTPTPQPSGVAGGETPADPRSGSSNPFDEHGTGLANAADLECHSDDDCVCGIDRGTGACAVGPSSRIDTARQCPDFCHGIDGQQRIVCQNGRCTQSR